MMSKGYRGIFRLSSSLEYACVLKLLAMVITLNPMHILKSTELHFTCVNCMVCKSYLNKAVQAELTDRSHLLERGPGKVSVTSRTPVGWLPPCRAWPETSCGLS